MYGCSYSPAASGCNDIFKASEVERVVQSSIDSRSTIFTNKSTSYADLADMVESHAWEASKDAVESKSLRWVSMAISDAKRTLFGIYHRINMENLQSYFDEFVYKLNRRHFRSLFDGLLVAAAQL